MISNDEPEDEQDEQVYSDGRFIDDLGIKFRIFHTFIKFLL